MNDSTSTDIASSSRLTGIFGSSRSIVLWILDLPKGFRKIWDQRFYSLEHPVTSFSLGLNPF